MASPTAATTGKPPAPWTDTKYTVPVKTSQGGKMMAKVKDSKSEASKWGRDNLPPGVNPAFLPDAGKTKSPVVMSGKMAKEKNGLFIESGVKPKSPKPLSTKTHKPTYVKPFETDKSPVSSKTPKLVTTREEKTAMAWAPSPKIVGMQKKEGQIVLTTTAGEKKYPSGTPARREGEYLFIGQKPGEEKFYYPMKKSA